ncbi:Hypothetical predicted protein [Pelobates cultripes]|uniref:Uncharacterized protein n=1 Tax=Pelobates cultripes TaxID=61616 RepID=A0AAD1SIM1_PELCU|nr:Hypothetical predicted protein [Pelobates cultripes]
MAAAPTNHMLHWDIKFQVAFDTLCAAFWAQIESRQQQPTLTSAKPTEAPSTPCTSIRPRAKKSKHPSQHTLVVKCPCRAPTRIHAPRWGPRRPHLPACGSCTQATQHSPASRRLSLPVVRRACNIERWLTATRDTAYDGPEDTDHLPQPGLLAKGI